MKKLFAMALVLSLTAGLLTGCVYSRDSLGGDTSSNVVNVYNWGEYIDESVLKDFEAATGIKVNYQMYDSNETMYSKIAGGGANYDVVIPSGAEVRVLRIEGVKLFVEAL